MKVGFANGCFDLFHEGHRHFLTQCRQYCDYLVVAVNSNAYCARVKGADRPFDGLRTRMLHVRAFAEAVIPFEGREDPLIMQIRPDVVFKGGDHGKGLEAMGARVPGWKELEVKDRMWVAKVVRIPRFGEFSTTLEARNRGLTHARESDAVDDQGRQSQSRP